MAEGKMGATRYVPTDLEYEASIKLSEDEICMILAEDTRVALIKLLGALSLDDMRARKLSDYEHDLIMQFYHLIQP